MKTVLYSADTDPGRFLDFAQNCFDETLASSWSSEGIETFRSFLDRIRIFPAFRFFEASEGTETAGILVSDNDLSHVILLFVSPRFQKKGVGSSLIECFERASAQNGYTVNADPSAVGFYAKNGFSAVTGTAETKEGITTVKMFKKKSRETSRDNSADDRT